VDCWLEIHITMDVGVSLESRRDEANFPLVKNKDLLHGVRKPTFTQMIKYSKRQYLSNG
jgi:hypothetical protein